MGDLMFVFLEIRLNIVIFIWFGMAVSAFLITLLECYKKTFFDDIAYRMYCRFWLRLATLWYLGGSTYMGYDTSLHDGIFTSQFMLTLLFLTLHLSLFLILLITSLIPAKLQNWYGKKA